jgi:hypothetical protein
MSTGTKGMLCLRFLYYRLFTKVQTIGNTTTSQLWHRLGLFCLTYTPSWLSESVCWCTYPTFTTFKQSVDLFFIPTIIFTREIKAFCSTSTVSVLVGACSVSWQTQSLREDQHGHGRHSFLPLLQSIRSTTSQREDTCMMWGRGHSVGPSCSCEWTILIWCEAEVIA